MKMPIKDSLGNRMKKYEFVSKSYLMRRTPVILRIDGKNFSAFCKRFKKPYDDFLNSSLNDVMIFLCKNIQGTKIAERHSDEISFLLTDWETIKTDCFLDYNIQKISSIVSGMASAEFCRILTERSFNPSENNIYYGYSALEFNETWPSFDCRCFNLPENEVANYIWWRCIDGKRGSINMLAQSEFSHKELQNKTCNEMQEMLFQKKGINWGKLEGGRKAGFICIKNKISKEIDKGPMKGKVVERNIWEAIPSPENITTLKDIVDKILQPKRMI